MPLPGSSIIQELCLEILYKSEIPILSWRENDCSAAPFDETIITPPNYLATNEIAVNQLAT